MLVFNSIFEFVSEITIIQAGGAESPTLSNIIDAIVFGVLTVGGLVAGIICNKIGVRWTLILGTLGYAPYAGMLHICSNSAMN